MHTEETKMSLRMRCAPLLRQLLEALMGVLFPKYLLEIVDTVLFHVHSTASQKRNTLDYVSGWPKKWKRSPILTVNRSVD